MYHQTYLTMESKMDWVEEERVQSWEEGRRVGREKDSLCLTYERAYKRHQEAIEIVLKIVTDPGKLSEDKAEYHEQIGIKDELVKEAMKKGRYVNKPLETIIITSVKSSNKNSMNN